MIIYEESATSHIEEKTMREPRNGLINGMTEDEDGKVREFIAKLGRAGWLYDLDHTDPIHRQNAQAQLADAAATFKGFNEPQRAAVLRDCAPRVATVGVMAQIAIAFGLAAPITS
jgi:hypothetical protein